MKHSKIRKLHKPFYAPKLLLGGIVIGIVLATVGSVGALNGWFGGGGTIPEDTMTRGLVGYWPMDEGAGTVAYDSSNYANHGILTSGPTWGGSTTTCKVAGCLSFDGTDDYVALPNSERLNITGTNPLTITAWVKTDKTQGTNIGIIRRAVWSGYSGQRYYGLEFSNTFRGVIGFENGASSATDELNASGTYTDNVWHFGVFVYDGNFLYIYVDGVSKAEPLKRTISGISPASDADNRIGSGSSHGGYFSGLIDEVRVYNRALSAEEVRYHYNRGGPVAQWKFDEGEGRTAYDSALSTTTNNGTLVLAGSATSSAWVSGKYGSALSFDGIDDYVDADYVSTNARTISFWLKRGDTSNKDVIDLGTPEITISSNAITSTGLTSPTYYVNAIPNTTAVSSANQWYYITITDTADISASNVDIGKAATNYFLGLIDDVRIYNYARTQEEIRLDYNAGFAAHFGPKSDCHRDPGSCMTQGLVAYLPMDEGSGTATYDASNDSNHGIFSTTASERPKWGSSTTTCKVGGCLNFDGTNDFVTIEDSDSHVWGTSAAGAVETWISPRAYSTAGGLSIWFGAEGGTFDLMLEFNNSSGQVLFDAWSLAINSGSNTVSIDQWSHIVGTWGDFGVKLYINGREVGSTNTTVSAATSIQDIYIGQKRTGYNYNGLIDEVRLYGRALSPEEVRYHYNRGGPVAQWKFDEGEGRTAYDSTDNNNDGTLVLAGSATSSAWVSGKYGSALSFDGVDDYVDAGNVSANARTISFWLKRADTSDKDVIDLGTPEIKISSNAITSTGLTSPTYYVNAIPNTTAVSSANQWYHITITDTADISASNVDIGKAATNYFLGPIDDVRIYNYARTQEEIRLDYNAGFAAHFGPKSDCHRDPGSCMTQGLVGYWPMDEGAGTVAYDSSNYANHGTLTNGPSWGGSTTTCKVAGCISLDGTNDNVEMLNTKTAILYGWTDGAIELWLKPGQFIATREIWSKSGSLRDSGLYVNSTGGQIQFLAGFTSAGVTLNSVSNLSLNTWYHIVTSFDSSGMKIYINGVLDASNVNTGTTESNATFNFKLGESGTAARQFNGIYDEVRVYNRALSPEEVRYHYNRGGPVAQWKFDEGEGRTAYDSTDNNNDGTLQLAPSGNTATSTAWVSGKSGSALNFDGVDDYVNAGGATLFDLSSPPYTISTWVKFNKSGVTEIIMAKNCGVSAARWTFNKSTNDKLRFFGGNLTPDETFSNDSVPIGQWVHAAVIWDGQTSAFFVNGKLNGKPVKTGSMSTCSNPLTIGVTYDGTSATNVFNGPIDDVRIYNYARSPLQIQQDYNVGLGARFK